MRLSLVFLLGAVWISASVATTVVPPTPHPAHPPHPHPHHIAKVTEHKDQHHDSKHKAHDAHAATAAEAAHAHSQAHGHAQTGDQHAAQKSVKRVGKKSKHDEETARKGQHETVQHKVQDAEHGGKKHKSHEEDHHQSHKKAGAHSEHGAAFQDAAKHKKTGFSKGFREQYHKNEHKKHDSFYSNGHKSGDWKIYGSKKSNHHGQKFDKDDHGKHITVKSLEKHGKQGKKASGHNVGEEKGHKSSNGKKTSHEHQEKWAKKSQQKANDKHKYKYLPVADTKH